MGTQLGQAYVQIMPSARGIQGSIQNQLNGEASAAGDSAGGLLGGNLVAKLAGIIAAAKIGQLITKGISASISEGANLQQSLGGIETLFKGSADKVKQYANEAYKTSGLSANDYMENVTSFSASLLQSLGGDTAKAADVANMAMVDMSDNANKMGTNIGDIQNAYQGFAKQNYTMLDNLKLGYGGTKEEMQRLLDDASKLSGVKYDMSNLNDVYSAIHVVQKELDITGTTAKEAASTFSGSFASMKSSWSNVLGGLSLGQDIKPALNALAETTSTFLFGNLIPMVTNVVKGLPEAIVTFFKAAAPQFLSAGTDLMNSLGIGISGGASGIFSKIQTVISPIIQGFQTAFSQIPGLFQTIVSAITPFIETLINGFSRLDFSGIQSLISNILPALQAGITTIAGIVKPAFDGMVNSLVGMWNAAQPLLTTLSGALMPAFQVLGAFLGGVLKGILMGVSTLFDGIKLAIELLSPVIQFLIDGFIALQPVFSMVAEKVGFVIGIFGNLGTASQGLGSFVSSAWTNIQNVVKTAASVIDGAISWIKTAFSGAGSSAEVVRNIIDLAWMAVGDVINTVKGVISKAMDAAKASFSSFSGAVSSVSNTINSVINGVKNTFRSLANIDISGAGSAIMNGFLGGLKSAWEGVKSFVGGIASWIKEHKGPISYDKKLLIPAGKAIMDGLDGGLQQQFKNVQATVAGMGDALSDSLQMNLAVDNTQNLLSSQLVDDLNRFKFNAENSDNQTMNLMNIVDKLSARPIIVSNQMDKKEMSRTLAVPITDEQNKRNQLLDSIYGRG